MWSPRVISKYINYKMWNEIIYLFPNFNGATVEVWEIILSHTFLDMWLIIHAGIKIYPC